MTRAGVRRAVFWIIGALCVMITLFAVADPLEKPVPVQVRKPARTLTPTPIVGAGGGSAPAAPTRAGVASVKFIQSVNEKRSFETVVDGAVSYTFGFDSWQKESQQECEAFAQQILAERQKKPDVDAVSVVISTRADPRPYFRFRWARPAVVKTGEYAKYSVDERSYE